MRCGRTRRLLWPENGPRAATPEMVAAQTHLAACAACQQFIREMRDLGETLRLLAPRPQAPAAVRERAFTALARARVSESILRTASRRPPWWVTATVLLLAGGMGLLWITHGLHQSSGRPAPLTAVAEDHMRSLSDHRIVASESQTVARWLGQYVSFAIRVPTLPEAQLEGGRLCVLHGQRGVVLWYRVAGTLVSYYIMPSTPHERSMPALSTFHKEAEAGYRVVAWREDGLLHALVGDLPYDHLLGLARICATRMADANHMDARFRRTHTPGRNAP